MKNMEIRRYVNGNFVKKEELASIEAVTPELEDAVRDARKRADYLSSRSETDINKSDSLNG